MSDEQPSTSGSSGTPKLTVTKKQKDLKVSKSCLICGVQTDQLLNIFEPRRGPNIVDVIFEKYGCRLNLKPERVEGEEEKFICYHCNNWLINWYSVEHPQETTIPYEREQSSKSSSSSGNLPKRTKTNYQNHEMQSSDLCVDEKENQNPQLPVQKYVLDVAAVKMRIKCIERMREFSGTCGDYVPVSESHKEVSNDFYFLQTSQKKTKFKCYYCHKKFSNWIFRREHVQIIHPKKLKTKNQQSIINQTSSSSQQRWPHIPTSDHRSARFIDENIVKMLKKQGTFIVDELTDSFQTKFNNFNDSSNVKPKKFTNCLQRNEANEIILSFNTVITEVVAKFNEKFIMKDEILMNFTKSLTANC